MRDDATMSLRRAVDAIIAGRLHAILFAAALAACPAHAPAQAQGAEQTDTGPGVPSTATEPGVEIEPQAGDDQIGRRIHDILAATGWFADPRVDVRNGVVFLDGTTQTEAHREWAHSLSLRTDGVVAVVNRLAVKTEVAWTLRPAMNELRRLADRTLAALPLILLALVILPLAWVAASLSARLASRLLSRRVRTPFLRDIIARAVAIPVFLLGVYVVLQVAGLTQLALSLIGGAGVLGIVIGFAFRDIAENFLASLLLSIRQPFSRGDLIEVSDRRGFVQSMNTRSTVLVSEEGNHIQIPNAVVFKSIIHNLTAASNQRGDLSIGIGYDASVTETQRLILGVLQRHPAVCTTPEPMALVETLGASTVNMKGYYWFDGKAYSPLKLRSMLLRQVKTVLTEAGISMPDEAREVIFPQGVPVIGLEGSPGTVEAAKRAQAAEPPAEAEVSEAEHDLSNEVETLEQPMTVHVESDGADLLNS